MPEQEAEKMAKEGGRLLMEQIMSRTDASDLASRILERAASIYVSRQLEFAQDGEAVAGHLLGVTTTAEGTAAVAFLSHAFNELVCEPLGIGPDEARRALRLAEALIPDKDGKNTRPTKAPDLGTLRMTVIPRRVLVGEP